MMDGHNMDILNKSGADIPKVSLVFSQSRYLKP